MYSENLSLKLLSHQHLGGVDLQITEIFFIVGHRMEEKNGDVEYCKFTTSKLQSLKEMSLILNVIKLLHLYYSMKTTK